MYNYITLIGPFLYKASASLENGVITYGSDGENRLIGITPQVNSLPPNYSSNYSFRFLYTVCMCVHNFYFAILLNDIVA